MRMMGLVLGVAAAASLAGCPASEPAQQAERESISQESDTAATEGAHASEPNAALTTQYIGNAFVSAARAHNAIVQGNPRAARNEVWAIRRQLRLATQWANLDQQREINRLEGQVIELEARLVEEADNPQAESAALLRNFLTTYDTLAAGEGGGAGTATDFTSPRGGGPTPERR